MSDLEEAVARTAAVLAAEPDGDGGGWAFARCWLRLLEFERDTGDHVALGAALDDFDAIPERVPGRPKLAAMLINAQIRAGGLREGRAIRRAAALAEIADADPKPLPAWPSNRAVVRAYTLMELCREGDTPLSPAAALAELDELDAVVGGEQPQARILGIARIGLTNLRAQQEMDLEGLAATRRQAESVFRGHGPGSPLHDRGQMMTAALDAQAAVARGDLAGAAAAVDRLRAAMGRLAPDDPLRGETERMLDSVAPFLHMMRPDTGAAPTPDPLSALRQLAGQTGLTAAERALRLANLGMAEAALGPAAPRSMDEGVRHLAEAVAAAPETDPRLPFYCSSHGFALIQRYEVSHRRADLTDGVRVLERARTLADNPAHPYWAMVNQMLGHAHRLAGRAKQGREIGLAGLRGHAWSVLLQAHTAAATAAARDAAGDAIDVARWCLADNAPDDAVAALDAGRGLIVYAATQMRGVAEQLDAGHPELAERWRQATAHVDPGEVGVDLRREVLRTLSDGPGAHRLLDPPSTHEIRAALIALGVDALVYLVPGDQGTGAAVVVPAHGETAWRPLPRLAGTAMTDFDTRPGRVRDAGAADEPGEAHRPSLDDVADWAWPAAIGPVLEMVDLPADGSGRIVLIPMRDLARVPWHAARRRLPGGGHEHAIQRAGFSYAASARLICESAWSPGVAVGKDGLVVGDPDTGGRAADLPAARAEAVAIRASFYPAARYLGRFENGETSTAGTGRRAEVADWLADPGGGAMLHLACHAVVDPEAVAGESAYLLLAGGERLSAEELVRGATAGRDIALVVLAACRTGVSSRGHDEAFSLATTFLAGNIRSVVSSQWSVPDEATSVLMYAFHHFLHAGRSVADALRAAQLWLLDERRDRLPSMPDTLRGLPRPETADWAGFVHSGR